MGQAIEDVAEALLDAARRAGAEAADALVAEGAASAISVRGGALENAERSEWIDVGLRVLLGGRQACVSASEAGRDTVAALAERAVAMAREAPEDPHAGLAAPDEIAEALGAEALELADPAAEPAPERLREMALAAEAAALGVGEVVQAEAGAGHSAWAFRAAATNGFSGGFARTSSHVHCTAFVGSGTGMEQDHHGEGRAFFADLPEPGGIGALAGARAAAALGAAKPPTGAYPVVFDERVAGSLIGHLLGAANGDAVARGASWLLGRIGEPVLPEGLSVIEDPHRRRASASNPFDAEGLPTRRRAIVDAGRLTGWTLDLATARRLGMAPTGNAGRGPSAPPRPRSWNVALTEGDSTRGELLREMGTGLLVTSMIGATINPNTGDYSRGVSGFWVEGGEIARPVNECTIAGSLPEMLLRITPANDARRHLSRVVPSLLVEGLTLAGG